MGPVKLCSVRIVNMLVLVSIFLVTVAASPLPQQKQTPVETSEETHDFSEAGDLAEAASSVQSHSRVPTGAIAAILAAANARPTAIDRSPGYGKRSAKPQAEVETTEEVHELTEAGDLTEAASSVQSHSRVPSGAIAAILAAANARPTAIDRSPGYGKRSADKKDGSETKVGLVDNVPLDAVKVVIHSSRGNIAQHYDGDLEYQNAVLGGRFGRAKRETDDFIPFSVYDTRRVNTLKLEQNDFLALPARQNQEKKERNFSEN